MSIHAKRLWAVLVCLGLFSIGLQAQQGAQVLTQDESTKLQSWISQDGLFIAYVGDKAEDQCAAPLEPQDQEIFLLDVVNHEVQRLTTNDTQDTDPSMSADGELVAFSREVEAGKFAVFLYDAVAGEERPLSGLEAEQTPSATVSALHPMISADGSAVVYEQDGDIFIVSTAETGEVQEPLNLTNSPDVPDQFPALSGDGGQIVFSSTGDYLGANPGGDEEIFMISALGNNLRQLTHNEVSDAHPWVSADGTMVAFERAVAGPAGPQVDVFLVPSSGTGFETNLTNSATMDEHFPTLSADGGVVAFEVQVGDTVQYAKMKRDGTELTTLSTTPSAPLDRAGITLTGDGASAAFSALNGSLGCRQVFLGGALPNVAPLANGGGDQTVAVGQQVQLDAADSSDPNNDPLTFTWDIISKPEGSSAVLDDPHSATPTFEADVAGEYLISLEVEDGRGGVDSDKVHVLAEGEAQPDTPPAPSTVEQAIDVNANQIIDDDEMINAITLWVLGTPIPGTDLLVGDDKVLELVELWIVGAPFEVEQG